MDYRRQFGTTAQKEGEDPSIFAIALETLAVRAFEDIEHAARLRLIRDLFIAGHDSCALHRHLDSVSLETPIWDIVDHCRMWESHADTEAQRFSGPGESSADLYGGRAGTDDRMVAVVTIPPAAADPLETLLRCLLPTPVVLTLPPKPVPTELERMLQRLLLDVQTPKTTPPAKSGLIDLESLLQGLLPWIPAPAHVRALYVGTGLR